MRDVVLYELLSLDGVAEEPGDWMFDTGDEVFANLAQVIATQDDVLLGRGTYDYWVDYWPTSDVQPFADFINTSTKHVFSSTAPTGQWANTTVVDTPAEQYVRELKATDGADIGVHGSIGLARSLLQAGLVDRMRLVVAPTLAWSGNRLFDTGAQLARLELIESSRTAAGALLLHYRVRTT